MIRETVRSEIAMPNIFSSPWIRGARQSGLAATIRSINRRISMSVAGRAQDDGDGISIVGPRNGEIARVATA